MVVYSLTLGWADQQCDRQCGCCGLARTDDPDTHADAYAHTDAHTYAHAHAHTHSDAHADTSTSTSTRGGYMGT